MGDLGDLTTPHRNLSLFALHNNPPEFGSFEISLRPCLFAQQSRSDHTRVGTWFEHLTITPTPRHRQNEDRPGAISRSLVFLPRHGPGKEGVTVDTAGWATFGHLVGKSSHLRRLHAHRADVEAIVSGAIGLRRRPLYRTSPDGICAVRTFQGDGKESGSSISPGQSNKSLDCPGLLVHGATLSAVTPSFAPSST